MKHFFLFIVAAMLIAAFADTPGPAVPSGIRPGAVPEIDFPQIRMESGAMSIVETPFVIKSYSLSNNQIAKVEIISERQIRVSGLKSGSGDLQVIGENINKTYRLVVGDNLTETLAALKKDLDTIPEIRVSANQNRIALHGEISSLDSWEMLNRVLTYYNGNIVNLVQFRPAPEVMLRLQKNFEQAGYKVVSPSDVRQNGELTVQCSNSVLTVSGTVYSPEDISRIGEIVKTVPWVSLDSGDRKAPLTAQINVRVVPALLELNAVCISFDKTDIDRIGYNFIEKGIPLDFRGVYDILINNSFGMRGSGGSINMQSELNTLLQLFATNTNSYARNLGYVTFRSNDTPNFREFHDGGTLKIKVTGIENGSLEDIPYGFILKVKGGLTGTDTVALEVEIELSHYSLINDGNYDLKKNKVSTSLSCKLNDTIAIAGFKEYTVDDGGPKGVPYLRNVPGLSFFFSTSDSAGRDKQVLIVISPTLVTRKVDPAATDTSALTDTDPVVRQDIRQNEESNRNSSR